LIPFVEYDNLISIKNDFSKAKRLINPSRSEFYMDVRNILDKESLSERDKMMNIVNLIEKKIHSMQAYSQVAIRLQIFNSAPNESKKAIWHQEVTNR